MKLSNRIIFFTIAAMALLAATAHACPNCFASSKAQALEAYYVSIAFMGMMPFGMVAGLVLWLKRKQSRFAREQESFSRSQHEHVN
ncbi:MAG: hypothetical protein AAB354_00715 [candidate division KSB1 bacterium]